MSAFRQPYTSPNPPLPIILCTLKSFIVNCKKKEEKNKYILSRWVFSYLLHVLLFQSKNLVGEHKLQETVVLKVHMCLTLHVQSYQSNDLELEGAP